MMRCNGGAGSLGAGLPRRRGGLVAMSGLQATTVEAGNAKVKALQVVDPSVPRGFLV